MPAKYHEHSQELYLEFHVFFVQIRCHLCLFRRGGVRAIGGAGDCILLDLLMPGLSGQETCLRIKAAPSVRDVPLIMLTALEDRLAMIHGLSAGADDYMSKSSQFDVLKASVRRIREELLRTELETAEARAARELAAPRAVLGEELDRKIAK